MAKYYWPHANGRKDNFYFGDMSFTTQKAARKYCIDMLRKYGKYMASFDIYELNRNKRPYFASPPSREDIQKYAKELKLIGSVHIDRGLPEYVNTKLEAKPLNMDGSFKARK